jgi:hypothetical protein
MHPLNNSEKIGKDFFAHPTSSSAIRLEMLYNQLFGSLPIAAQFSEEFSLDCIEFIDKHFDSFATSLVFSGMDAYEEGFLLGKQDSEFEQMVMFINYRSGQGSALIYDHGGLAYDFPSTGGQKTKRAMYVRLGAVGKSKEQIQSFNEQLHKYRVKDKSKIYMLTNSYGELTLTSMPVDSPEMELSLNYGDDFTTTSESIIKSLNEEKSGLYLFHGSPGTGKSSYIKYLCSGVVNRKIAYIPVGLISSLTSPDMLPLLMDNKDLVLVIEDAEKALVSRDESGRSDLVSTILNLTDGFLGQSLNISVVATFNTAKEKIDEALLRKGRLRHCYEFKKLSQEQASKLAKTLGKNVDEVVSDMTLADIYYMETSTGYEPEKERRVGFC